MATFEQSDYAHSDAAGFINLSWLGNIGKPSTEEIHGSVVETKGRITSDVYPAKHVHAGRLVSTTP
jgi:hypothetical protein